MNEERKKEKEIENFHMYEKQQDKEKIKKLSR